MKRKDNMPDLVYYGLLGINSKNSAYVYLTICVALGLAGIYFGLSKPVYFWGALMFVAACWYYYCINWVDNNSSWDN